MIDLMSNPELWGKQVIITIFLILFGGVVGKLFNSVIIGGAIGLLLSIAIILI